MEDMATGEIRLSILWEWLHKNASLTADDEIGVKAGRPVHRRVVLAAPREEYEKLRKAGNRDVHDVSKNTTLPIAREIVETYVMDDVKLPWYIDLLNINLDNYDLTEAKRRIRLLHGRVSQGWNQNHREPGVCATGSGDAIRPISSLLANADTSAYCRIRVLKPIPESRVHVTLVVVATRPPLPLELPDPRLFK